MSPVCGHSAGCLYLCGGEARGQDGYLQSSAGCTPQSCIPRSFPCSSFLPGLEGWVGAAQSQLIPIEELRESDKIRKGNFPSGTNGGVVFPLSSACLRAGRLPLGKPEGRRFLTPWSWEGMPGELPGEREREVRAGCFGTDWPCLRPDLGPQKEAETGSCGAFWAGRAFRAGVWLPAEDTALALVQFLLEMGGGGIYTHCLLLPSCLPCNICLLLYSPLFPQLPTLGRHSGRSCRLLKR